MDQDICQSRRCMLSGAKVEKSIPKKALPRVMRVGYDEHKDEHDALVGKMRWIKTSVNRGGVCYPVLVLSVNKETVSIWDGEEIRQGCEVIIETFTCNAKDIN
eukprot:1164256_1